MAVKDSRRPKWYDFVCSHDDKTIDRNLLTRKQHEELLSIPRPMFGPPPAPPRGKKTPCNFPKLCPPRIDQLALPTTKLMKGVLEYFNETLEPVRIVRLVKLIHTKETERPLHSAKKKKKKVSKTKHKKDKKKECLKIWLKRQSRKSAKLIVKSLRERRPGTPNYRQLLVALGLMKTMKIKKKKHVSKYTQQYLMKICEQLAIICDTEWAPCRRIPEAIPLKPVESVVSKRHIFWKMLPFEEEEEMEVVMETEEEGEEEEEETLYVKEERVSVKEEAPSETEIGEESTSEEEYRDYERELEKELEGLEADREAEEAVDFITDEEGEEHQEDEVLHGVEEVEENIPVEEVALGEEELQVEEEGHVDEELQDEGEDELQDEVEEAQPEEEHKIDDEPPAKEGEDEQEMEEEAEAKEESEGKEEGEEEGESEVLSDEKKEEAEAVTTEGITDEIEGGLKSEGGTLTEEGEPDTVAPEDTDFEPLTEVEEGSVTEIEEEIIRAETQTKIIEEEEEVEEEEKLEEVKPEKKEEKKPVKKPVQPEKQEKIEVPPVKMVEDHPPNTVSYLSWIIYSHWLEEFGGNIQTYGKCLHNFKTILEAGTNVQADKIRIILTNWCTYLKESMQFEKDITDYFRGKKMTKCAKCGDYTLYNIPQDHEIPNELKQAATSTGRWKKLLEEAEELCRSFTTVTEDTISLVSHESVDVTESYVATSETSMYVVEDFFPSRR